MPNKELIAALEAADGEEWLPVTLFGGGYEVSSHGRVRNSSGRIMSPSQPRHKREYQAVNLRDNGLRKRFTIHKLVASAFIGPGDGLQVRHLDGDHMNNRADNLAWGTSKENAADRARHGNTACGERHGMAGVDHLKGEDNPQGKLTNDDVRQIRALVGSITQREIAKRFGVHQGTIWKIIAGRTWAHVG